MVCVKSTHKIWKIGRKPIPLRRIYTNIRSETTSKPKQEYLQFTKEELWKRTGYTILSSWMHRDL